ncbi:MAG TPA: 30S ribosome-binding factor RbfA [Desulfobulbaceae bacterium]|nr:30S ribosome-binding factor RbfA [Desulfobulbaceae bacterium]
MEFDFTLPGLGKPQSSRPKRVAEAIKNELSILLLREVADPRLATISFSQVMVSPDLKLAKIYFVLPVGGDAKKVLRALRKARGFFRSHLAKTLNLRYTPDLAFYFDDINEEVDRIDTLLREIAAEHDGNDDRD